MNRKSDTSHTISVGFFSLGCAKNLVDSQVMADTLLANNIRLAPSPEEADVVIVNTCSFIQDARDESLEMIRVACELKETGPCRAVLVAGCLPQRYAAELPRALPDVDAFIGLDQLEEVGAVVRAVYAGDRGILDVSPAAHKVYEPGRAGVVFTGGPYAYLKIAEGCNHQCAFCAIPGIRGPHRSRSMDSLVSEAERLLAKGFRELNLISQDTTSYGSDLTDGPTLPKLLRALGGIGGQYWIRTLYGYPSRVSEELLETMAVVSQVCPYLDVPIQHSHPDMLTAMGRAETVEPVRHLVERVRTALPGAVVRTTCLVGFPGETEEHFSHLLDFVRAARFDHLGVFTYSPEEGTRAFDGPDAPPSDVAEERRNRLMQTQQEISEEKGAANVGCETTVLLERPVPDEIGVWEARSAAQAPEVDGTTFVEDVPESAVPGDFVRARYIANTDYDMVSHYLPDAEESA